MKSKFFWALIPLLVAAAGCHTGREPDEPEKAAYIYADNCIWAAKPIERDLLLPPHETVWTRRLTVFMAPVSVQDALRYICTGAGLDYRLESDRIVIADQSYELSSLCFQIFTVSPAFAPMVGREVTDAGIRAYFESLGIRFFYRQFKLHYQPDRRLLFIRHGTEEMAQIEKTLRLLGVFESKAFDYDVPLPPPPKTVSYQRQLELVLPLLEADNLPVRNLLLLLAAKVKAADPEHRGITLVFSEARSIDPMVLTTEDWWRYTSLHGVPEGDATSAPAMKSDDPGECVPASQSPAPR
ncbi:MAG: hypothetical protein WC708_19885 [Lentisphaeria bacterium]